MTGLGQSIEVEVFICSSCKHEDSRDKPRCAFCGTVNTYEPAIVSRMVRGDYRALKQAPGDIDIVRAVPITEIEAEAKPKIPSGFPSFDRVLSGGMAEGAVILLGGDPGGGKSTLSMQVLGKHPGLMSIYGMAERNDAETALEGRRLESAHPFLHVFPSNSFEQLMINAHDLQPSIMVVDSLQAFHANECNGRTGGDAQTSYMMRGFYEYAHEERCTILLICHLNKEGEFAGRRFIEYWSDVLIFLERGRFSIEKPDEFELDKNGELVRISSTKNRYGGTINFGFLSMKDNGLVERPATQGLGQSSKEAE